MGVDPISAALIGGAATLGSSLISGGNNGTGSQSQQTNAPWGPQQQFLTDGYGAALKAYNARVGLGPYTANQVAGGNNIQTGAIGQANQFASTEGASQPYNMEAEASTLMGSAPGFASTAQGLANGQDVAMNPNFGSALTAAGTNGANAINNFTTGLQGAANTASEDPTYRIAGDAAAYASSPTVQNSVNATNAQIQQTLNEQTVPGLNREAEMGGTLNSSRAGMAEGLANEGAGIAEGTADAGIYSNAYTQGLNTANSAYATGLGGQISANEGGLTGENAVANTAGNQNLNYQQANVQDQLAGNAQQGNAVAEGLTGAGDAVNDAAANYSLGSGAGGLYQTLQQVPLTNAYDAYQQQAGYNQTALNNYDQEIGGNVGSQQSGTVQNTLAPNYAGSALGGAAAGAGLYNQYFGGGSNNNSNSSYFMTPYAYPSGGFFGG